MSRLAKKLLVYPETVTITVDDNNHCIIKGPKGELSRQLVDAIVVTVNQTDRTVAVSDKTNQASALLGLSWALLKNMIIGVSDGFSKSMALVGVGYKVEKQDTGIRLFLGYSHPIDIQQLPGISFDIKSPTAFSVVGIDNQKVGQVAADIRLLRKPDAYKGKGVRYADETIRLKAGKSVK